MKKIYFSIVAVVCLSTAGAQALLNNNGASIYVKDGGFMIVKTNSLANAAGGTSLIDNAGTIVVEGNIQNDGTITAAGDTIRLQGNWINNSAYTGSSSWVDMYGGNQQITGTAVTVFNNLNLGGGAVVKQQTINAETTGELALNNAELATDVNEMLVSNTATGAITRNQGFVSSLGAGVLSRATNLGSAYLFPVGSPSYNNGPSIFRPVEMTPASSAANIYSACLVKGDATADGYDISSTDDLLCKVNPNFYHRLYHGTGADAAALTMFFDAAADGDWTDEAHWDSPSRWNYLGSATAGNALGFTTITVAGVSDFLPEPFALARKKFTVDAGPDVTINLGGSTTFNPVISTSAIAAVEWTPDIALTCNNCQKPVANPTTTTRYTIHVTDDGGCEVSDSLLVKVQSPELLIPTAFSPNGDGVNDLFRVVNKNVVKMHLQVYNRWGELVYDTTDPLDGWDGKYQDVQQELGVYIWQCDYLLAGQSKSTVAKGNVTLMR